MITVTLPEWFTYLIAFNCFLYTANVFLDLYAWNLKRRLRKELDDMVADVCRNL